MSFGPKRGRLARPSVSGCAVRVRAVRFYDGTCEVVVTRQLAFSVREASSLSQFPLVLIWLVSLRRPVHYRTSLLSLVLRSEIFLRVLQ